jgi:large subunit ribosomal protein L9
MKVILKEDVKGLGEKDSMVQVSDGYARNYLIPRGIAVEANAVNINIMKSRKNAEKTKKDREFAQAKDLAKKLEDITLILKAKSGESGKLFGSITGKDISDKLKSDFNLDIDKKKINLPDALKSLGSTEVEVKLYPQVSAKLTVRIEQE